MGQGNDTPRRQCKTCPWKVGTDPNAIPGYSLAKHRALTSTIADPGDIRMGGELRMMACHYSPEGSEKACVGWLANQLGPGNNIALRLRAMLEPELARFELDGPQRARFEETLPKRRRCEGGR